MSTPDIAAALTIRSTDATEISLDVAGLGARSYAFLIDWHVRLTLALAWLVVCVGLVPVIDTAGIWEVLREATPSVGFFVVVGPMFALYALYHPVLELIMHGRTPGKRMAGVQIVDQGGHPPGVGPLLMRNVFRLIDSLPTFYVVGVVAALITRQHVRIGDIAAGTLLVYERRIAKDAFDVRAASAQELERRDLARELLGRWRSLERPARVRLAQQLLGESRADSQALKTRDRELHARLETLARDTDA